MTQRPDDAASIAAIEAPISYLVYTGETPTFHQSTEDIGKTVLAGTRENRAMTIRNGRPFADSFSLDVQGFAFTRHRTKVADFWDDDALAAIYTPEVERLVAAHVVGATKVVVFDHTRRSTTLERRDRHLARDPAGAAHTDYTDASARQRLRDVVTDPAEAEARLAQRFAIVNVWRSTGGPIEQWPLAVCDARSIDDALLHTVERMDNARKEPSFEYSRPSETRHAEFDAGNRWYWFPRMDRNEAILLKNYDTATDGTARYALHTAFDDPTTPPDAAPRESIESRVLVFFD